MLEFVMTVRMTLNRSKEPGPPLFSTLVSLSLYLISQGRLFLMVLPSNVEKKNII